MDSMHKDFILNKAALLKETIDFKDFALLKSYEIDFSPYEIITSPYFLNIYSGDEVFLSLQKSSYKKKGKAKYQYLQACRICSTY